MFDRVGLELFRAALRLELLAQLLDLALLRRGLLLGDPDLVVPPGGEKTLARRSPRPKPPSPDSGLAFSMFWKVLGCQLFFMFWQRADSRVSHGRPGPTTRGPVAPSRRRPWCPATSATAKKCESSRA